MQRWSRLGKAVRDSTASHSRSLSSSTSTGTSAASTPATTTVASAGRVNPDHRAASLAFAAWLQQHGLKGYSQLTQPHDSAVASTPRVLGFGIKQSVHNDWQLVASCPIAANQPILSLPLSLTVPLDDRYGRGYSALDPLVKLVPQQLWQLQLGMRLLSERTKQYSTTAATASFYQPYIDLLPLAYTTPLFYQRDDVLALQYPPMQQQINKRSRLLSTLSQAITANQRSASSDAFHGQSISPSLLGWAMSAVSSRAFSFHSHRRLLPLIDMANHSFTPSTRIEATDTHPAAITMYATRDLQPGDELTISYGPHSNDAYLIDYGFVIDDNPYDDLLLTFDLNNVQLALELIGESGADVLRLDGWRQRLVDGMDRSDFRITRDGLDRRLIALWLLHLTPADSSLAHSLSSLSDTYFSIEQPTHSADTIQRIHRATSVYLSLVAGSWNRGGMAAAGQGGTAGSGGVGGMEEDLQELMEAARVGREERTTAIRYRIAKKRLLREQLNRIERHMSTTPV